MVGGRGDPTMEGYIHHRHHLPQRSTVHIFNMSMSPLQRVRHPVISSSANLQISDPSRLVLCAMVKSLDRNVGYIVDALKAQVRAHEGI